MTPFRYIYYLIIILFCSQCTMDADLPNIVFILADDMGYGDIRALNPGSKFPTPNMDRLAAEGMYFSDAHSPSAVCTPTRYGILTGRYCFRSRLQSGVLVGHSPSLIEPGRETVATLLKESGYHTGCVGKWHLGLDFKKKNPDLPLYEGEEWDIQNTNNIDYHAHVDGGPCDHGFDYSFILPASLDIQPYLFINNKKVFRPDVLPIEGRNEGRGLFWRHGDASVGFDFWKVLPLLTEKAADFIREHATGGSGHPFFLYFPLTAPHTPWVPADEFQGRSQAGDYGDFVAQVDHTAGVILNLLDSLRLSENTLVILTSDNGSHWKSEDIAQFGHKANYIFRGMKSDLWEGGQHVPFLVRWPAVVKPGTSSDQLLCLTDLMATCCELTGRKPDWNTGEDSFSFLPILEGRQNVTPLRNNLVIQSVSGEYAIRKDNWKLLLCKGSGGWSSPGEDKDPPGSLYDLKNDTEETVNLYDEQPEKVRELEALLNMYQKERRSRYQ